MDLLGQNSVDEGFAFPLRTLLTYSTLLCLEFLWLLVGIWLSATLSYDTALVWFAATLKVSKNRSVLNVPIVVLVSLRRGGQTVHCSTWMNESLHLTF